MKGKIIKYFSRRGFGFIAPEGSQDEVFFHVSNYPELVQPEIGKGVEFVLIETPKGKEATKIEVLADVSAEEPVEAEGPEAEGPEAESPEAVSPEAESPEAVSPEAEIPEAEIPEAEIPEAEIPEAESPDVESPGASVLGVGEIKGVGKATEEKLRKGGFETVESIASVDADAVSEKTGVSAKVAAKIVASAKELLE